MIRLDIFTMFTFTNSQDPSTPLWEVVANSMPSFWQLHHFHKGFISIAVHSLLLYEHILSGTPVLHVVNLLLGRFHRVHPANVTTPRY